MIRSRTARMAPWLALAAFALVAYSIWTALRRPPTGPPLARHEGALAPDRLDRPTLLFRHTALGPSHGDVAIQAIGGEPGARRATALRCDRVHYAGGHGVCLRSERGVLTTYHADFFDRELRVFRTLDLAGFPSRARISPDGRRAATTVFVAGHSYLAEGFSTETRILDAHSGEPIANLEEFAGRRDGEPFAPVDRNFWGVTFAADDDRFFASLGAQGSVFLVSGSVRGRSYQVLREGVECPSLSPDGTRIAFKKRQPAGGVLGWRLHVLDLASGSETPLAEPRSVDDQVEWLDDRSILYALPDETGPSRAVSDVWRVPADGGGRPERLIAGADSPVVLRTRAGTGGAPR